MRKLKDIRSIDDLKEFILLNKETIKKAALPVTVAAALLFFWAFGGEKKKRSKRANLRPRRRSRQRVQKKIKEETCMLI